MAKDPDTAFFRKLEVQQREYVIDWYLRSLSSHTPIYKEHYEMENGIEMENGCFHKSKLPGV